jgi:hypothetical protein
MNSSILRSASLLVTELPEFERRRYFARYLPVFNPPEKGQSQEFTVESQRGKEFVVAYPKGGTWC